MTGNKNLFPGFAVLLGTCVLMILSLIFLSRAAFINTVLAAAGMGLLLAGFSGSEKKRKELEDLVRPLAENDYPALEKTKARKGGPYEALEKSLESLGKFNRTFRAFTERSASAGEFLRSESREREAITAHIHEVLETLGGEFGEIESTADQAVGAVQSLESYLGSLKDAAQEQSAFMEKTGTHFAEAADLARSVAGRLGEKEADAESLRSQVTIGEEKSRAVRDIIRNTAQDLEKIAEMTEAINQISEQTNILSMNAAIESAHAGAAGAGFAVVASEIKKLAGSTKLNARDIQQAVKEINRRIKDALNASELASDTLGSITGGIGSFTESLASINEAARKSSAASGEIEAALKESASIIRKVQDGGVDIMAHQHSFRSALEQIHNLTGKSRTELKEIQTGTREVLENVKKTQEKIRKTMDETGVLDGLAQNSPPETPVLPAAKPALPPAPASIEQDNSWRRDVAVKSPPQTI